MRNVYVESCNEWKCPYNKDGACSCRDDGLCCESSDGSAEYDRLMKDVWSDGRSFMSELSSEKSKAAFKAILDRFGKHAELLKDESGRLYRLEED